MGTLGFRLLDGKAKYFVKLPKLSDEEISIVSATAERVTRRSEKKEIAANEQMGEISTAVKDECCEQGFEIDSEQEDYLSRVVFMQTYGLGFLGELLSDDSLEEIAIAGIGKPIYVFVRKEGWKKTNIAIESQDYFVSLVNRLGRGLGRRLTSQQPRMNATLPDGSRIHASMPPVSDCELTIRRFGKKPISVFDLLAFGTYDARMLALLSLCVQADLAVLFCGNTASGKTTTLNAMLSFIPQSERVLIIEETPEISIPHSHQVRLLPFEEGGIGMVELVRDSLRMRPDRVVVGEVRKADEAKAYAESALSGQAKGSYATFHAQSSRDAVNRLRMMGCQPTDMEGIGVFVVQRRVSIYDSKKRKCGEERRVTEIAIGGVDDAMRPIQVYYEGKYSQQGMAMLLARISAGTGMALKEAVLEMKRREGFFLRFKGKKAPKSEEAFKLIQTFMYGGGE